MSTSPIGATTLRPASLSNLDAVDRASNIDVGALPDITENLKQPSELSDFSDEISLAAQWREFEGRGSLLLAQNTATTSDAPRAAVTGTLSASGHAELSSHNVRADIVDNSKTFAQSSGKAPLYNQYDTSWSSKELGQSTTIGGQGCAMISASMVMSKITGQQIVPDKLNDYLNKNNGYNGNNLNWNKAAAAADLHTPPAIGLNFTAIHQQIDNGRPVAIGMDYKGEGNPDHYLAITRREGNTYYANDSVDGKEIKLTRKGNTLTGESHNGGLKYTNTNSNVILFYDIPRQGSSGSEVSRMQQLLKKAGFDPGEEGTFGDSTRQALERFQSANGLQADGECGPRTWAKLEGRKWP